MTACERTAHGAYCKELTVIRLPRTIAANGGRASAPPPIQVSQTPDEEPEEF